MESDLVLRGFFKCKMNEQPFKDLVEKLEATHPIERSMLSSLLA
jgi:hypothetical protein